MKKAAPNICPVCGRKAITLDIHSTGEVFAVHSTVWKQVKSSATGKMIECEVLGNVCRRTR